MKLTELQVGAAYAYDAVWDDDILIILGKRRGMRGTFRTELTYWLISDKRHYAEPVTHEWANNVRWGVRKQNINLIGTAPWQ